MTVSPWLGAAAGAAPTKTDDRLRATAAGLAPAQELPLRPKLGQRHLMIDDALLDTTTTSELGVAAAAGVVSPVLRMHPARKTGQIVITPDRPWEGVIFYYDSIVQVTSHGRCCHLDASYLLFHVCFSIQNIMRGV
jgi:hypothetical protein